MLTIQFKHAVKEFQVLLFKTNNSIQHYSIISMQFNSSKYCYLTLIIQLIIRHLFTCNQVVKQFYF